MKWWIFLSFFFVTDPYSVKRNVARTLNNQPVFEYILHCLRTTYKYFALPNKITKSSLPKPLSTVTCLSEHSKEVAEHDPGTQAKEDKLKNSVLAQEPGAAISTTDTCMVQPLTLVKETVESFGSPPSEELGNGHVSVRLENRDRIKAGASCDEHEDIKEHHQETGSETGREGKHPLTADDQGLRCSRRGEFVTCHGAQNNETESTLPLEGFQNPAAKACDGFTTSEDKADVDEEGIEGTDDLEDALSHFAPSRQGHTSGIIHSDEEEEEEEEEDDDEEPRLSITQREDEDDLANEDELENTYTGSGDEDALSEEEDELGESAKCKDSKEGGKLAAGALLTEFSKICLKEENTCEEGSTVSDFFYEFSKLTFTKGKVISATQCHLVPQN